MSSGVRCLFEAVEHRKVGIDQARIWHDADDSPGQGNELSLGEGADSGTLQTPIWLREKQQRNSGPRRFLITRLSVTAK